MHMSALAARRTQVGKQVVHGMHSVLTALDTVSEAHPSLLSAAKLKVRFLKPVYVGDRVEFLQRDSGATKLRIEAVVDGITVVEVRLDLAETVGSDEQSNIPLPDDTRTCRELTLAEMAGRSGTVRLATIAEKISSRFPHAARYLGVVRVGALLCLSRLVGMECPGLHSLFWGIEVEFAAIGTSGAVQYYVASFDDCFGLLEIEVDGLGVHGRVDAFARTPPATQPSMAEVASLVAPNEFAGQRALVVGGSRGLGELTAKILASGGGHPFITYAVGKDDAERVAAEIMQQGGECSLLQYDVRSEPSQQLAWVTGPISSLYYYATCHISTRRIKRFDRAAFNEFLNFYVHGFYELCCFLKDRSEHRVAAFYPSSAFVEERPRDMTEYSMAKAAGEILCEDLNLSLSGLRITVVRLPRLLTDQTASVVPTKNENALEIILPIVRNLQNPNP